MKIFLDTNVFYNNWFVKNANFKFLFHFLNNECNELLLSELVVEETNNIRERELVSQLNEINSSINRVRKLNREKINFDIGSLGVESYDLKLILAENVNDIINVKYDDIPHKIIVKRALDNKKPFSDREKGYRDTLIWLSFLQYLRESNDNDDVVFISENSSDFFSLGKGGLSLNEDLLDDVKKLGIKQEIIPFKKLHDFVVASIDKNFHAFDHAKSEALFEDFLEVECNNYLSGFDNLMLSQYLFNPIFESKVSTLLDVRVDIFEDFEDGEIVGVSSIDSDRFFVAYTFNLRRVFLEIDIPFADYMANKSELDSSYSYITTDGSIATLEILVRPYFSVSFIFSPKNNKLDAFSVDDLWLKR